MRLTLRLTQTCLILISYDCEVCERCRACDCSSMGMPFSPTWPWKRSMTMHPSRWFLVLQKEMHHLAEIAAD